MRALVLYKRSRNLYGEAETVNALGVGYGRLGQTADAAYLYLKAVELRLEKLGSQVQKDRVWSGELANLWAQYKARADKHAQEGKRDEQLTVYRWWLEEYRVSLFAQQLGTKVPISDKRLSKQWSQVEG